MQHQIGVNMLNLKIKAQFYYILVFTPTLFSRSWYNQLLAYATS